MIMVSALNSGTRDPGSSPGHCIVFLAGAWFLGKTLYLCNASVMLRNACRTEETGDKRSLMDGLYLTLPDIYRPGVDLNLVFNGS